MAIETVEDFRLRARDWLADNMPKKPESVERAGTQDDAEWARARELQQVLHAGGFAGMAFPSEYGGLGLTPEHQYAFTEESAPYEMPLLLNVPSLSICSPTILDMGSEEQKRERISKAISGEEILCQFLSEPSGGSNLAGVLTRAERDGDSWVINGSKIWSTSAYAADYALCLTRTDWGAPKHRGLTMFLIKVHQPGVELNRMEMVNGSSEFCQEFFTDLVVPASAVVGEVNDGWTVATQQLFYERQAVGGASPYTSGTGQANAGYRPATSLAGLARELGISGEPWVRDLVAQSTVNHAVQEHLIPYVVEAVETGRYPGVAMSLARMFHAETDWQEYDAGFEIAGSTGVTHDDGDYAGQWSKYYLMRQAASLGGGSSEMSRNIISERLLKMPREQVDDKDVPFREVRQGR